MLFKRKVMAVAIALAFGLPTGAYAQTSEELEQIRQQIKELKDSYESRIQALEKRLKDAEAKASKAEASATEAQQNAQAASSQAQAANSQANAPKQASPNAFNPAISLILNGTYGYLQHDPSTYGITGFQSPGAVSPGERGFSLGESELFVTANVDHLFLGALNLALLPDNSISVEEAYFQTLALGHGLTLKGGRFFSAIGYQNSIHAHAWDFVDSALVQRAFLGDNYGDDGLQVSWVAPLPLFVELGAEVGRGSSLPGAFSAGELVGNDLNKNGVGKNAVFLHVGGDIGDSQSYRVGVSHLRTQTGSNPFPAADFNAIFSNGNVRVSGVDFVYKWAPEGNWAYRNFKLAAEWFQLRRSGDLTFDPDATAGGPVTDVFRQHQSGWYVQGVYQFHPYWRTGLRYDQLQKGSLDAGANAPNLALPDFTPKRWSAMLDWNPSEFSRIRLQYNNDKSQQGVTDNQILLQYIYSLGTHGAHKF